MKDFMSFCCLLVFCIFMQNRGKNSSFDAYVQRLFMWFRGRKSCYLWNVTMAFRNRIYGT